VKLTHNERKEDLYADSFCNASNTKQGIVITILRNCTICMPNNGWRILAIIKLMIPNTIRLIWCFSNCTEFHCPHIVDSPLPIIGPKGRWMLSSVTNIEILAPSCRGSAKAESTILSR